MPGTTAASDAPETARAEYGTDMSRDNSSHTSDGTRKQTTQDSSLQKSLFSSAGVSDTPAWTDSTKGRLLVRFISRGIVGAAFFVAGSRMAVKQLDGYHPEHWDKSRPLQWIAKGFDATLTPLIREGATLLARIKHPADVAKTIGEKAVTFRDTRDFKYKINGLTHTMNGRSYGADIVGFTFDFAMMSVGDSLTRNVIQAFDPNVKQRWKLNDKGEMASKGEKWHFAPGEFAKWTGQTAWRIVSKNQMEDWAAAIPYAFQMKFQRQFLSSIFSKRWDGHKLVFDHSWNGGAYRINQMGQKVADYQLPAAIDFHFRFVGYNVYTLVFREAYDAIGQKWNEWKQNGFKIEAHWPEHLNPITAAVDGIGTTARYLTKSFIKANMYMNPAVVFFWATRVPQSKWRGRKYIEGDPAMLGRDTNYFSSGDSPFAWSNYKHFETNSTFDKAEKGFSMALNPIGQASNWVGTKAANIGEKLHDKGFWPEWKWLKNIAIEKDPSHLSSWQQKLAEREGYGKLFHEYTDASLSYYPYIAAKQEFGLRVDDNKGDGKAGQMDVAIYKFMDDVASFKFTAIPEDIKKMWVLGTNFEREIKVREGGGPDAQEVAKNAPTRPTKPIEPVTTVSANTIAREPANMGTAPEHGKPVGKAADAANDHHGADERSWAQSVVGSDIHPSRIHSGTATRH